MPFRSGKPLEEVVKIVSNFNRERRQLRTGRYQFPPILRKVQIEYSLYVQFSGVRT